MQHNTFKVVTLMRRPHAPKDVLNRGDILVAIKFDEPQNADFALSPAQATDMATKIRAMIARRFGNRVEPSATEVSGVTVTAGHGTVQVHVDIETRSVGSLVMPPEAWLWFADKLVDRLPETC